MKIGSGQRTRLASVDVDRAQRIVAWNQANPATRGPHPDAKPKPRSASPWRKGLAKVDRVLAPAGSGNQ